jgi:polysaccharide deacetylase family protein (PEP-CTERM system associated)
MQQIGASAMRRPGLRWRWLGGMWPSGGTAIAGSPAREDMVRSHFFTVDVEEYFQVSAFEGVVGRDSWASRESRVERSVDALLDLLARHQATATFFVLGWIAQRHRDLMRRLADAGHELASHGWEHRRVTELTPEAFRESVRRTRSTVEDITGIPVLGYRAPSFSIVAGREWALDILLEEGYAYDSSLFPVRRNGYGYPSARRDPYWLERPSGRLAEFPPATLRRLGYNLPAAGGAYLRLFPLAVIRRAVRECESRGTPATLYIHPWELDPDQPRLPVHFTARLRHYTGLRRTLPRLERLLGEFRFTSIGASLTTLPETAGA